MATSTNGTVVYIDTDDANEVTAESPKPKEEIEFLDECNWKEIRKPSNKSNQKDDTYE